MIDISVVICTHNPRPEYLRRVLDALKAQTLSKDKWELLLIDNASKESLSVVWNLSWHPLARHIREDELGLTPARVRGINESTSELLVFVDDDNVLSPVYLEKVLEIHRAFPQLGCYGAARIMPEFATPPAPELSEYVPMVGLRFDPEDHWANSIGDSYDPIGAGLCVVREAAEYYKSQVRSGPIRMSLDRRGDSLLCHGDTDIVWTACRAGYGKGVFVDLELTHLIPASRLGFDYLINLFEASAFSAIILQAIHQPESLPTSPPSYPTRLAGWLRYRRLDAVARAFARARKRGRKRG